jgi:hypothetical protein
MLHPTFEPAVMIYGSGGTPLSGLAAADLNADRKPDLLVANFFSAATPYMNGSVDVLINTIPYVQRPINSDGSSTFKASRGVIPIKFDNTPTHWRRQQSRSQELLAGRSAPLMRAHMRIMRTTGQILELIQLHASTSTTLQQLRWGLEFIALTSASRELPLAMQVLRSNRQVTQAVRAKNRSRLVRNTVRVVEFLRC